MRCRGRAFLALETIDDRTAEHAEAVGDEWPEPVL